MSFVFQALPSGFPHIEGYFLLITISDGSLLDDQVLQWHLSQWSCEYCILACQHTAQNVMQSCIFTNSV